MSESDPHYSLHLAAIVDSSDDAIISKNLEGVILSWNKAAERIFGYTREEAVGQSILMLIPPDRQDEEPKILQQMLLGQRIGHFETIRQTKDGRLLNVSVAISPIRDQSGKIIGAAKVVRDIRDRVNLKRQLSLSEERFGTTLSSIGDAVIATDQEGNVTFMNAVAEALTGWKEAEARGQSLPTIFKIVNEHTRQTVENPVVKVLETGGIVGLANHTILIAKDGSEHHIDDSGAPIREGGVGEISGVVLVFRDVGDRRMAELAAQRLAAIIQSSDDAIIGKTLDGIITNWNEGAARLFGYEEEEILGKSIMTLIPPELQDEEKLIIARLQKGERVEHFETTRRTKDGRMVQVSLSISPIRDSEGMVIGASKIARDVTQRKEVEQALAEAQKQLQQHASGLEMRIEERTQALQKTVAELEAFSYSLTHDLRAPLRAVQSFLQIFLEDYGSKIDNEGRKILNRVIASAQKMDRMILELLTFTRLTHEAMPIELVQVEKLIGDIINDRPDFQPPNAMISMVPPLLDVMGNEASLNQCLTNLLDNAIKFVVPGTVPKVRISSEHKGERVRLWIEDNGIGIGASDQQQLFRIFHRVAGREYPGTGIGLAIVRKAVERMGGTVGLESTEGTGSRFWLELNPAK